METIVISLGGSLIVPDGIDVSLLKGFKEVVDKYTKKDFRFAIVCGGGRTARDYMGAAEELVDLHPEDVDWLGIHATRINAHLLRTIFRKDAHFRIIKNPTEKIDFKELVLIAAGWKPGCSSDFDAVLLARNMGIKKLINLSNIKYVYDKDPNKFDDAKKIEKISWNDFRKIVGNEWDPGLNAPFDPVASREAEKDGVTVVIADGKDLDNFEKILNKKEFKGTVIS